MCCQGRPTDIYIVIVTPMDNCEILKYIEGGFISVAVPATSLLFFFRLKAVYWRSRTIITIFGIFWLATAGLGIYIMLNLTVSE
jgi:hypothetical protein